MREALKATARALSFIAILPLLGYCHVVGRVGGHNGALESCSQLMALLPGLPGQYLRRAFLARVLASVGDSSVISFGVLFSAAGTRIGNGAYIGPFCTIGLADIGDDVLIAAGAQVPSGPRTHGIDAASAIRDQPGERRIVRIGRGSWIGNNAVILADVGEEAIVGAGAVVTKPVPSRTIVAGVPARVIRSRDDPDRGSAG